MTPARLVMCALPLLFLAGCSSVHAVTETPTDRAYFDALPTMIPQDRFWVPAETRFKGLLAHGDLIPAQSTAMNPDTYFIPAYTVVREALTQAVEASFALPYRADRVEIPLHLDAQSDALDIEFSLPAVLTDHEGGAGEMTVTLKAVCYVRYPPPDSRELARIPMEVTVKGEMDEDGQGVNGMPGPLWMAAAELAKRYAKELQGPIVRHYFADRSAYVVRVHSTTGEPADASVPDARFDPEGKYGEYVEVVRLIRR